MARLGGITELFGWGERGEGGVGGGNREVDGVHRCNHTIERQLEIKCLRATPHIFFLVMIGQGPYQTISCRLTFPPPSPPRCFLSLCQRRVCGPRPGRPASEQPDCAGGAGGSGREDVQDACQEAAGAGIAAGTGRGAADRRCQHPLWRADAQGPECQGPAPSLRRRLGAGAEQVRRGVLGMFWPVPLLGYLLGWVGCDDFHQIGVPVFDSFVCLVCLFVLPRFAHPVNLPPFFCLSIGGCFRALYRKSHGSYEPGEQKRRDIPLPPEVRAQIPKHQRGKRLGLPLCEYLLDFTDSPSTCLELLS